MTIGFSQGGGGKIFQDVHEARIFFAPLCKNVVPPPVWRQSYKRGGQKFVIFIHHDLQLTMLFCHCIFFLKQ